MYHPITGSVVMFPATSGHAGQSVGACKPCYRLLRSLLSLLSRLSVLSLMGRLCLVDPLMGLLSLLSLLGRRHLEQACFAARAISSFVSALEVAGLGRGCGLWHHCRAPLKQGRHFQVVLIVVVLRPQCLLRRAVHCGLGRRRRHRQGSRHRRDSNRSCSHGRRTLRVSFRESQLRHCEAALAPLRQWFSTTGAIFLGGMVACWITGRVGAAAELVLQQGRASSRAGDAARLGLQQGWSCGKAVSAAGLGLQRAF